MVDEKNILYVIPARGGSKGIPGKNIKDLAGKPLICYSIDIARELTTDDNICVSTDDEKIINVVEDYGLNVPFKRPAELATDRASTNDVLLHAINYYETLGKLYEVVVLLQPTSPLRKVWQVREALNLYNSEIDMVVSVKESKSASVLCVDNNIGFIDILFNSKAVRRQEISSFFEINGAIYVINTSSLKQKGLQNFSKRVKYIMDETSSVDIDTPLDWLLVENIINR